MKRSSGQHLHTSRRAVAALLLVGAMLAPAAAASAGVLVSDPIAGEALAELRAGYAWWLRGRLEDAGLAVTRAAVPVDGEIEPLLALARDQRAAYAIVPDLRLRHGTIRVGLRLFEADGGALVAKSHASTPLDAMGDACRQTVVELLAHLGVSAERTAPPRLGELAAAGRALALLEDGELMRAWREAGGKLSPSAQRLRQEIVALARGGSGAASERARVLAASGDAAAAWTLIVKDVRAQAESARPDPAILLAAAEVELARNRIREARKHVLRLIELDPGNADVQRAHGELLLVQRRIEPARTAFAEAARLEPDQPDALLRLEDLQAGDPEARARTLLEAAEREERHWDLKGAERLARKAATLSPEVAPAAHAVRARTHARSGRAAESLEAWREAAEAGGDDAEVWLGIGRAERELGRPGAEQSLRRALSLEPRHPEALAELGQAVLDQGRPEEAVPLLRSAVEVAPHRSAPRQALAQALSASGKPQAALAVLDDAPADVEPDAEILTLKAAILRRAGASDEAIAHLEWAVRLDPHDTGLQRELAALYEAAGRTGAAAQMRALAGQIDEGAPLPVVEETAKPRLAGPSLDGLVLAFSSQLTGSRRRSVALLGVREARTWQARLRQWLDPRAPDLPRLQASLEQALGREFDLVPVSLPDSDVYAKYVDRIFGFHRRQSTDAAAVAALNDALGSDALFAAEIVLGNPFTEPAEEAEGPCAVPGRMELQLRMLSGSISDDVSILHDRECFPAGLAEHGVWNRRALVAYLGVLLFLVYPMLRGWGTLVVEIKLPPRTRGFLHIKVGTRPEPVASEELEKKPSRLRQILDSISRYRKDMAGRTTVFRWIPARRREYYVSVRGPLLDANTKEIIGHFIEEQRFRCVRGKSAHLTYDMVPEECAVQVDVMWRGAPARAARVALREQADSLRYARGGSVFYYLGKGSYTVCMGALDRAREHTFEITSLEKPVPVVIDLAEEEGLAVRNCEEAVDPFLVGDFAGAAAALEAAGEGELAQLMRAAHHRQRGDAAAAAAAYQSAGRVEEAAEMFAADSNHRASAQLFENAGDHDRAAESYRAAGDLEDAARCYVAAYDYENAAECFEAVGDVESLIAIHEKTGAYLDAAQLAKQYGNLERALQNLQEVEKRDPSYAEACRLTAEILSERGQFEVAAQWMAQAISQAGGEAADVALHARHAELLDMAGDADGALTAWQTVRRLDPSHAVAEEHVTRLRAEVEQTRLANAPAAGSVSPGGPPAESRYEILGEVGRGGMGVVYKARDKRLNRVVALKRLPDNLRDNAVAAQLFLREAQAAAALNHRNIVTVYDAGEENGVYQITMELLDGLPFSAIQERRGTFSVGDTAALGLQVCAGLHYAQTQRIVHRDIKTANLFLTRERVVKIMDFGLAKTIEEVRRSSTVIGGTPYYMAPEQAAGEAVDNRTDLYAFGVTLFRMLTGTFPFTEGSIEYHHRHTPPPDPREFIAEIPEDMAHLVLDLLEKDPEARPGTAAEVARRLQEIRAALSGRG